MDASIACKKKYYALINISKAVDTFRCASCVRVLEISFLSLDVSTLSDNYSGLYDSQQAEDCDQTNPCLRDFRSLQLCWWGFNV
jgi:hypothetical protein